MNLSTICWLLTFHYYRKIIARFSGCWLFYSISLSGADCEIIFVTCLWNGILSVSFLMIMYLSPCRRQSETYLTSVCSLDLDFDFLRLRKSPSKWYLIITVLKGLRKPSRNIEFNGHGASIQLPWPQGMVMEDAIFFDAFEHTVMYLLQTSPWFYKGTHDWQRQVFRLGRQR